MNNPNNILLEDNYQIFDKLKTKMGESPGPKGWVRMFIHNNPDILGDPEIDKGNLIVANGREFVAQKLFEISQTESSGMRDNFYNYKISHFSVGSGGASVTGDDVTLNGPLIKDKNLYRSITLGDELYLDEPSGYEESNETPLVHSYHNAVKPITKDGSILLNPVSYEDSSDYYTTVKCTCKIPAGEPSSLDSGTSVQISEAGLYFINSSLADSDPKKVQLFSHVCFSPKWCELESILTIEWFILC